MKRNVDLTENMDFRGERTARRIGNNILPSLDEILGNKVKFPWIKSMMEVKGLVEEDEVIATGNKNDRKSKLKWVNFESGLECECCGLDASRSPWRMSQYTICMECDEHLEQRENIRRDLIFG